MNNKKMQEQVSLLGRLRDNGVPLSGDDTRQKDVLLMQQIGEPGDSRAYDLGGGTGYKLNINLIILTNNMTIPCIDIIPVWQDPGIALLCDPLEIGARCGNYYFHGKKPIEFERNTVLNHRLIGSQLFRRRASFQGLLLWTGLELIPSAFPHGSVVPATVVIYDQFDVPYTFQFNLLVDRSNRWTPGKRTKNPRVPLFAKRDLVPM